MHANLKSSDLPIEKEIKSYFYVQEVIKNLHLKMRLFMGNFK